MNRRNWTWKQFFQENLQWMIASLILAFGLWVIAVLQSDPVEEQQFSRPITINFLTDDNRIITNPAVNQTALVTIRAPQSVWEKLRAEHIEVMADLRGREDGMHRVELEAELRNELRGKIVEINPNSTEVKLEQLTTQRIPVRANVDQAPPSGYTYNDPSCELSEVTARGPAGQLEDLTAIAALDLSQERNPVTMVVDLNPVDTIGQPPSNVTLDPNEVSCSVEITQLEGVSELSVVPTIEGFPPEGYIYEGYEFEPKTVVVNGRPSAIRELNGVVNTEPISLEDARSNFERVVSIQLPEGVRLQPGTQTITVQVKIGTVPSSRQYSNIPVLVEGLGTGLRAELLPNTVTVFAVGPQPLLEELSEQDLRVDVNLEGLESGTYQRVAAPSVVVEELQAEITLSVQPAEINVTITQLDSITPTPTPR